MAAEDGGADPSVVRSLLDTGYNYSFFQAVRLLQDLRPGAPRVGHQGPPEREAVRFRPSLNLSFAPSDIGNIRAVPGPDGSTRYEITTNFMGLYGTTSPLPTYYTEDLLQQDPEKSLVRGFLDLFHHRVISLFYRAWEKYRYAVQFSPDGTDPFSRSLLALLGVSLDLFPEGHRVPPLRVLAYAGLISQRPHSSAALRGILADYFQPAPIDIEACVGQWLPVPHDQQNRLGEKNSSLGGNLTLGERVYDRSCTFRVVVGPVGLEDFMEFLPSGDKMAELREIVDLFNSDCLDYEIEVRIRRQEIPELRLASKSARLGWTTWPGARPGADPCVRFLMKGWRHGGH